MCLYVLNFVKFKRLSYFKNKKTKKIQFIGLNFFSYVRTDKRCLAHLENAALDLELIVSACSEGIKKKVGGKVFGKNVTDV